jgi:hypothetical protein
MRMHVLFFIPLNCWWDFLIQHSAKLQYKINAIVKETIVQISVAWQPSGKRINMGTKTRRIAAMLKPRAKTHIIHSLAMQLESPHFMIQALAFGFSMPNCFI